MKVSVQLITVGGFLFLGIIFPRNVFAATTPFRSAHIITTDGATPYTNLGNCSATDGATCDRASAPSFANLYFRKFGTYADFGMPTGSVIHHVRVRVTGKVSTPIYVGLSEGGKFTVNCQSPSDLWRLNLLDLPTIASQTFVTALVDPLISHRVYAGCLSQQDVDTDNFSFRINYSSTSVWSANIDNFEIAFDYDAPVVSPTPTVTPTPAGPTPFLDLPWDYEGKGLSFNEAALAINSYFDHTYPFLSSGISEESNFTSQITSSDGHSYSRDERSYSSHDGYDYGRSANARLGDHVLAAASGSAQYVNSCRACGNMIKIDHGNGYQTRYLHLQKEGLIISTPGIAVSVAAYQLIGKVGATGNVSPSGDAGAHIHFDVIEDKNHDGNFDDNIPDGMTDPFGWQSTDPDPWEQYTFTLNNIEKTGNKSYYLWKEKLDNLDATLTSNGGIFTSGKTSVAFEQGTTNQNLSLHIASEPQVTISPTHQSIGSTVGITLQTLAGGAVTLLTKPMLITMDFNNSDTSLFKLGTFSIYSSTDNVNWVQENSFTDYLQNKTSATVDHLTHFALIGELADTLPPTTMATVNGTQGQLDWYRSDVSVSLTAVDNADGLGVDYTMVRYDDGDWDTYDGPIGFGTEGHHSIEFYSVDNAGNIENVHTVEFTIDKTPPEALWQYNSSLGDLRISEKDESGTISVTKEEQLPQQWRYILTDQSGNSLRITTKKTLGIGQLELKIVSLQYNNNPEIVLTHNVYTVNAITDMFLAFQQLTQTFVMTEETTVTLIYNRRSDMTTIVGQTSNGPLLRQIKSGIALLQFSTQHGTLQYSY